jgi:predicted Rossmann-fold nucleotide-binding protein
MEQDPNDYITPSLNFEFHYFFMRKLWFLYHAKAIVFFPGGYGTLDELFETLTLVQTRKYDKYQIPVLLYDRDYWLDLINFDKLIKEGYISEGDTDYLNFFNSVEEGMNLIKPLLLQSIKRYS